MNYNHDRPLSDFDNQLKILRNHGYNPIAMTQLYFEDTFVFKTLDEATKAYAELEIDKELITGWFYEEDDFIREIKEYEERNASKVLIYWLNN